MCYIHGNILYLIQHPLECKNTNNVFVDVIAHLIVIDFGGFFLQRLHVFPVFVWILQLPKTPAVQKHAFGVYEFMTKLILAMNQRVNSCFSLCVCVILTCLLSLFSFPVTIHILCFLFNFYHSALSLFQVPVCPAPVCLSPVP